MIEMNLDSIEVTILRNLLFNEEFLRKVVPFIKSEYFENINQKIIFEEVVNFVEQYNKPVTKEILCIEIEKRSDINDSTYQEITKLISYFEDDKSEFMWFVIFRSNCSR